MRVNLVVLLVVALLAGGLLAFTIFGLAVGPQAPPVPGAVPEEYYPGWEAVLTDLAKRNPPPPLRARDLAQLAREMAQADWTPYLAGICAQVGTTPENFLAMAGRLGREAGLVHDHEQRVAELAGRRLVLEQRLAAIERQKQSGQIVVGEGIGTDFIIEEKEEVGRQLQAASQAAPAAADNLYLRHRETIDALWARLKGGNR